MKPLGDFFKKFQNLPPSPRALRIVVSEVIQEVVGCEVDESDIKLDKNAVFIQAHPLIKSEIYIKKQAILELLVLKLPKRKINQIY